MFFGRSPRQWQELFSYAAALLPDIFLTIRDL